MGANFEVDTDKPIPESGDSTDKKQKALQMMNKVFGAIKGKQFSMKVDAEGKVLDVTGFENIGQSIADSMGLPEEDRAEIMKALDKQFNSDQIKGEMQRFWYIFPKKEVKVGDSWAKNYDLGGALPGKYNSTYKVTDIEGDMVTLEEKTKIESKDEKMSLKGDVSGTIVVDSRSGLVVNADQDIKMTTEAGGMSFETKGKTKIKGKAR